MSFFAQHLHWLAISFRCKPKPSQDISTCPHHISDLLSHRLPPHFAIATLAFLPCEYTGWLLPQAICTCSSVCPVCIGSVSALLHDAPLDQPISNCHPNPSPPPPPSRIHFYSWSLVLANMLHNFLICLIVCILSLQCKRGKGQNLYLFGLVRHLECLAYSPVSAGQEQLITMRADVFHVVCSCAFHQSAYVVFPITLW